MSLSERIGDHLRGNAVGYLALFLALTGTSYAAHKVTTRDIKRNAIVSKLIKDGEVTSADVADNGLTGADIDESTLQGVNVLLADGSVTTAKLADAAVTLPKLAFDPATQAELDAATTAIPDSNLATITTAGKVADTALSANVALLGAGSQTFTGANTFQGGVSVASSSPLTTAFDASDPDIGTAIDIGSNDIKTSGATITSTQLEKLANTQTRAVNFPVTTFADFDALGPIDYTSGADTAPDFSFLNTTVLIWDATGGSVDTNHVVVTFTVPPDYASSGAFAARISQPSAGGALEAFECAVSKNAAATGGTAAVTLDGSVVFPAAYTVIPPVGPGPYAAGDSIGLTCRGLVGDNAVRLHSIEFTYQANR